MILKEVQKVWSIPKQAPVFCQGHREGTTHEDHRMAILLHREKNF